MRAALAILDIVPDKQPKSVGADNPYDTRDFVAACREPRRVDQHFKLMMAASKILRIGRMPGAASQKAPQ